MDEQSAIADEIARSQLPHSIIRNDAAHFQSVSTERGSEVYQLGSNGILTVSQPHYYHTENVQVKFQNACKCTHSVRYACSGISLINRS